MRFCSATSPRLAWTAFALVAGLFLAALPAGAQGCLGSLPNPPLVPGEPGSPACPASLSSPQACDSCTGTLAFCRSLSPGVKGPDDGAAISQCVQAESCKCAKLAAGTFNIKTPIVIKSNRGPKANPKIILDGARIFGTGESTILKVDGGGGACSFAADGNDRTGRTYAPVIEVSRTLDVTLDGFKLDVSDLRLTCDGARTRVGGYAVRFNPNVQGARVSNLRLAGQRFGAPGYATGGATTGGIQIIEGANSIVQGNTLADIGYLRGVTVPGGAAGSSGVSAIQLIGSGDSCVARNRIERVSFGIELVNVNDGDPMTPDGDTSRTQVVANHMIGAAGIKDCDTCSQGRVLKLQACRDGAGGPIPAPLQDLSVRNNRACEYGGAVLNRKLVQEGSGIDLICGVQFSRFLSNTLDGRAGASLFALQLRGQLIDTDGRTVILGYAPETTTHHNRFESNQLFSGRNGGVCDGNCADININAEAPDQINIGRTTTTSPTPGGNTYQPPLRVDPAVAGSCSGQLFSEVRLTPASGDLGTKIAISTRAIQPGTEVMLKFRRDTDVTPSVFRFTNVGCNFTLSKRARKLVPGPGTYTVTADYQDGNSLSGPMKDQPVRIVGDRLGTLVIAPATLPPPVTGALTASPLSLTFTAPPGGPNPAARNVAVGSTGEQLEWAAFENAPWLTLAPSSTVTPGNLGVSVNVAGLAAGTYTANILLSSPDADELTIPVTLTVGGTPSAALTAAPAALSFTGMVNGPNPAPQMVTIGSSGAPLTFTVSDNAPWLTVSPASGTTPTQVSAAVNLSGLPAGTYNATVTASAPGSPNALVNVTLTVSAPPVGPQLTVSPASFSFSAPQGGPAPAVAVLSIGSTGPALGWSVADNQPWLTLSPGSGITPGATNLTINVAGLAAGTYNAQITVSAAGVAALTVPVNLTISAVSPQAPIVNGFSPPSGPPGTSVEVIGANFVNVTSVLFNTTPVPMSDVTVSSPTRLFAKVPAGATTGPIRVSNPSDTGMSFTPFTVTGSGPTITDINPKSGPRDTTVTLFGGNLTGTTEVAFGGARASFFPAGDNFLGATVPPDAPLGSVTVTVVKNGITAVSPFPFVVTSPPPTSGLTATASLSFNAIAGGSNPLPQQFLIDSLSGGVLSWQVSDDAPWLTLSPSSGATPGAAQATVSISGLTAGTYNTTITVSSPNAGIAPITRPVTLTIAPAMQSGLTALPSSITFTTPVGVNPPERTLTIGSTGGSLNWSVSANVPWLSLFPAFGSTPGSTFVAANVFGLAAGTYNGNVTITAPGAATLTVPVTLTVGSGGGGGGPLSVQVTAPNGGELFVIGQVVTIQWMSSGAASHDVAYSVGGLGYTSIATGLPGTQMSTTWRIPMNLVPSQSDALVLVRVIARSSSGATMQDQSNGFFTVFSPF